MNKVHFLKGGLTKHMWKVYWESTMRGELYATYSLTESKWDFRRQYVGSEIIELIGIE